MFRLKLLLVLAGVNVVVAQESAQYLQNAVRELKKTVRQNSNRNIQPVTEKQAINVISNQAPPIDRRVNVNAPPPLALTKGELAALYENAVAKGETVKLHTGGNSYVEAAVHELDGSESKYVPHEEPDDKVPSGDDSSGYYYYYYPIKSFIDELSSQNTHITSPGYDRPHEIPHTPKPKPHYQYHSHTHQHNVNITPLKTDEIDHKKDNKAMEPLFMAISGFVGMALMFILSVLVFPKFGIKAPPFTKKESINDLAKLALQAIDGQDCTERFACELGKTARSFNLHDNRFMKLLKRMAPSAFGKQIDKVGRYSKKRLQCTAIPCRKKSTKTKPAQKKH